MHVTNPVLAAIIFNTLINVAFGHLGEGAEAEFESVRRTGRQINEALIKMRLINQPGLAAHEGQGRIIRMGGEFDPRFFRDRSYFTQKIRY